jgi:hypothetical protein
MSTSKDEKPSESSGQPHQTAAKTHPPRLAVVAKDPVRAHIRKVMSKLKKVSKAPTDDVGGRTERRFAFVVPEIALC